MNEIKKEEYLVLLNDMCNKNEVNGSIANNMYSFLRRRFPWHFLMYSKLKKSEQALKVHKELIINQYNTKIDALFKYQLTQEDVDELDIIHEKIERICFRKENSNGEFKSFEKWKSSKMKTIDLLIEAGAKPANKKGSILIIK